jgi:hypothetical protein
VAVFLLSVGFGFLEPLILRLWPQEQWKTSLLVSNNHLFLQKYMSLLLSVTKHVLLNTSVVMGVLIAIRCTEIADRLIMY